jgi:3-methyl-2-oxobutanoate hydroxymethyltransferase
MNTPERAITIPDIHAKKARGEKITMLTAYDAAFARLLDRSGVDMLLVGDTLGMVVLGYENTLSVAMDDMVRHTQAVHRGASRALIVADLPFLSYHTSTPDAVRNAGRLLQAGAGAVKLEGGQVMVPTVERLVSIGIPVVGHLGLLPQSMHQLGGFRRQATRPEEQERLLADANLLQEAGAFAIVLECIPDEVAERVTAQLKIPTIGIGSGPHCDGQVLVSYDLLGLSGGVIPPFVKQYASLAETVVDAAQAFSNEVRSGEFPAKKARKK